MRKSREEINESARIYYNKNKSKICQRRREIYLTLKTNPDYMRRKAENGKKWVGIHKEQRREYARKHYKERYNEDNRRRTEYTQKIRREIIILLGNKCANPYNLNHGDFINYYMSLCIDHVNGGGTKERRNAKSYDQYLNSILNKIKAGSKDYQLLCANCNQIKKYKNKEGVRFNGNGN
jgi:hypothetical protein